MFVAVFSALSLVSVVGCADNSPVAAPTSTLPAEQPDAGSTDDPAEVAIPEYETDLDLDKEEKRAVEGALVAFDDTSTSQPSRENLNDGAGIFQARVKNGTIR